RWPARSRVNSAALLSVTSTNSAFSTSKRRHWFRLILTPASNEDRADGILSRADTTVAQPVPAGFSHPGDDRQWIAFVVRQESWHRRAASHRPPAAARDAYGASRRRRVAAGA